MIRKAAFAAFLAPTLLAAAAQAQYSLYATATVDRLSGIQSSPILNTLSPAPCTATVTTNCTSYRSDVNPIGFTGGGSYAFKTLGSVLLSADLRGVIESSRQGGQATAQGAGTRIYGALGGVRATFTTPIRILQPYAELAAGYARTNYSVLTDSSHNGTTYPASTTFPGVPTQNALEYSAYGGVDLRLLPALDFRVVEVGFGAIQSFGAYAHSYPLFSFSTGLVLHLPPR